MLGTNKKATTLRLNSDRTAYEPKLSEVFQCRFEPKKYIDYELRAKQITFLYMSDLMDIQVSDRILVGTRKFVAA